MTFPLLKISICAALALLTLAAYWGVQGNDFVNYDDYSYITQNPYVKSGLSVKGLEWAFTSGYSFNWHPLTWLSHMLDVELYGLHPAGHHWSSLILHLCNTLLLFLLLQRTTESLWKSALVAALFSLHPLHVESVAWASERKDVLSTLFWMATLLAYASYTRSPGGKRLLLALILFAFGLMSKPMVVTLPFVLLLLDFWPLERFRSHNSQGDKGWAVFLHLCMEKIPFFALSALSSALTFLIQKESGAVGSELSLYAKFSNALLSYVRYIFKMFWPVDLTCFYPYPVDALETWKVLCLFLLLLSTTFILVRSRRNHPYLLVGWFWYLGTLVPVIGLVQVGEQAMADRYTYIPLIGLFIMICWGGPAVAGRIALARPVFGPLTLALLLILLLLTNQQVGHWKNTLSLFQHEVQVNRGNFLAHFHLGTGLEEQSRLEEAKEEYWETLRIRPGFQPAHYQLGNVFTRLGRPIDALDQFSRALELNPLDYKAHTNMGFVLLRNGKDKEATHHFLEALRINPEDPMARHNLDLALRKPQ